MKLLRDFIQIEPIEIKDTTESGIILAKHEEQSHWVREVSSYSGKVLEIGKDVKEVKVGDTIYFLRWGIKHVGDIYLIHESDVLMIYE